MANQLTETKEIKELLFALLAETMEENSGIKPTAEQVRKNVQDRLKADKDTVAAEKAAKASSRR